VVKDCLWLILLYTEDAAAAAAAAADDDDDDGCWSNTIPIDAPSLLSSCRRLSQSCSHLAINNTTG